MSGFSLFSPEMEKEPNKSTVESIMPAKQSLAGMRRHPPIPCSYFHSILLERLSNTASWVPHDLASHSIFSAITLNE